MEETDGKLATWLRNNSIIFYIYPVIPMFFMFLLSMINSGVLSVSRSDYEDCSDSSDLLHEFLIGVLAATFILIVIYANLVLELIWKGTKSLLYNFYAFVAILVLDTIWCLIGLFFVAASDCSSEAYYFLAIVNIVVILLFSILMIIATSYYWCCKS
jgi:hypothetical protein